MKRRRALFGMLALGSAVSFGACERSDERQTPTERTRRVGLLLTGLTEVAVANQARIIGERLARQGFVEGRNLQLDVRRGGYSRPEDLEVIRTLVATKPDAILVDTSAMAVQTREATRTIPLVFTGVADPIGAGLIEDFAHPGGNATGVHFSQLDIAAKRLELLRELLPGAKRVLVARYLAGEVFETLPQLRMAASRLGFDLVETSSTWSSGFTAPAVASADGRPDAIYSGEPWVIYGVEFVVDQIIRFAAQRRIPSLFWEAEAAERGATMAYGVNVKRELVRATDQLARVLKGAKPSDLSIDRATEYELVVNRKAASALGIAIPSSIAARATRVIE
jgi:putative ABC transport system substrate-binding protein